MDNQKPTDMSEKKQYRYMALDLDGTLVNSQKVISPATKEALFQAQKQGLRLILCSGRPTQGITKLAEELELSRYGGFVVSFNGARIYDCKAGKPILEKTLPGDELEKVIRYAKAFGTPLLTHDATHVLTDDGTDEYVCLEAWINHLEVEQVDDLLERLDFPVFKFIAVGPGEHLAEVEPKMREALGANFHVMRSEPFFLEIMAKGVDKALALDWLMQHQGVDERALIACGDGYNDISMVKFAGFGVAMGNAREEVKACANWVTKTNDEDGLLDVLKRCGYGVV